MDWGFGFGGDGKSGKRDALASARGDGGGGMGTVRDQEEHGRQVVSEDLRAECLTVEGVQVPIHVVEYFNRYQGRQM